MDPVEREAWREADRLLDRLLDLPPAQREAALTNATDDEALRARVRKLLAACIEPHGPLDRAPGAMQALRATDALCGRRLGRWRLQHELGRGGMSVVYRAQACEGATGQLAAVKVLTLAAMADAGHERFLREQQVLLRLRHPYIVPLYDAGVAEDGTAWLAMALVEGERIDAWCDTHGCDLDARVRLVRRVCEALAYAHRNLVIHRDIKPSNVLVDCDGHVRLLDFGIARLVDDTDREATATAMRALTPDYAAPEQFEGAPPSTAMDVYGAGALLYRLVAGCAPARNAAGDEPVPPRRLVAADAGAPAWRARVRGDLERVMLKALASAPDARYPSVEAFSQDLARWLDGRPVHAHPPTLRYRLRKYAVRHRLALALGGLLGGALLAGLAGTLWQARIAREQAAHVAAANAQIRVERDRAEAAAQRAETVRDFLADVFQSAEPTRDRRIPDALDLLDAGSQRARQELMAVDPLSAADVLVLSGSARVSLNDLDKAEQDLLLALRLLESAETPQARALSQAHWNLGVLQRLRGHQDISLEHYRMAAQWARAPGVPVRERVAREISLASATGKVKQPVQARLRLERLIAQLPAWGLVDTQVHLDALNALSNALALENADVHARIPIHEERARVSRIVHGTDSGWHAYTLADAIPTLRKSPAHVARAEAMGREAVAITERVYTQPHMFAAVAACNLAALLLQERRGLGEAHALYDRALAIDVALQRRDLHAESCRYGRAELRLLQGDARGALEDLDEDARLLEATGRRGSALWVRNCGLRAQAQQRQAQWATAARTLKACDGATATADAPLAEAYRIARDRQRQHR